jgi:uncharacterized alkaline shock family protein YloU
MNVGERLVSLLAGIILFVVGIVFLILTLGWGQADIILENLRELSTQERWWALGVSGTSLLLAILAIRMALRMKREEKTIIHQTQYGEIRIAVSAVESLSLRACKRIKGVKDAHVGVRADLTGLDIFIEVTVTPDLSVPQISEEIKTKVDDYLFETVGIRVNSVKVLVTKIANEIRARVE